MNLRSIKAQLIIFLALFTLYLAINTKDVLFLSGLGISLVVAVAADSFVVRLKTKKIIITESSIISGLIIGCVLSYSGKWWVAVLAALLAIASKHIIKFRNRHFFNPAAFGVVASVFLLGAATEWKGASLWYFILPFGVYVFFKIKKPELIISYFISSFILFGGQAIINKVNVLDTFGYLNYFFIFIMLIEPMTTPMTKVGKIIFGFGTGALIFVLYGLGVKEPELSALLCFNLLTPLLNSA